MRKNCCFCLLSQIVVGDNGRPWGVSGWHLGQNHLGFGLPPHILFPWHRTHCQPKSFRFHHLCWHTPCNWRGSYTQDGKTLPVWSRITTPTPPFRDATSKAPSTLIFRIPWSEPMLDAFSWFWVTTDKNVKYWSNELNRANKFLLALELILYLYFLV